MMIDTELVDDPRAAAALRSGLRAQAGRPAFRPLQAADLVTGSPRAPRPARWVGVALAVTGIAAAAALILPGLAVRPTTAVPGATVSPTTRVYGQWTKIAPSPLSARWEALGVWVGGRYLVIGGHSDFLCPANADCIANAWLTDGALYDPSTNSWTTIAAMPGAARVGSPVALGSSAYLLSWESLEASSPTLLRYDASRDAWTAYAVPEGAVGDLVATDTRLVIVSSTDEFGGVDDQVFDPASGDFTALPEDPLGPSFNRAAVWTGDRLLLSGHELVDNPGSEEPSLMRLAELDETLTSWRELGTSEILGSSALYAGGRVVWPDLGSADGGEVNNWGRAYDYGGIYDPANGSWAELPSPPSTGGLAGSWLVAGDRVEVGGQLLDPATMGWTSVPTLPARMVAGTKLIGGADSVLAWGGGDYQTPTADGYLLWLPPRAAAPTPTPSAPGLPVPTPSAVPPSASQEDPTDPPMAPTTPARQR